MGERIRVNVLTDGNQPVQALVAARETNAAAIQRQEGRDTSEAIVCAESTTVARAPVTRLADASATRHLHGWLEAATRPAAGQQVAVLKDQHLPALGLEAKWRQALERLRPGNQGAYLLASVDRLSDQEVLEACEKSLQRWESRGREELARESRALARELTRAVEADLREFLTGLTARAGSVPEYVAVLRDTREVIEERLTRTRRDLEGHASADSRGAYRQAKTRLQQSPRRLFRRRELREGCGGPWPGSSRSTCRWRP